MRQREGRRAIGYTEAGGRSARKAADGAAPLAVQPEDLVRFGLIPEFVGRLPVLTSMAEMSEEDLVRILTEPKNCLVKQYQKLLDMEEVELTFDPEALREMARLAMKRKAGARGLRAVMEDLMMEVMFEAPGNPALKALRVTAEMVRKQSEGGEAAAHLLA